MLNNFYDEMNKTLLKTDVLLETVCQYYDIDTYYSESVDVLYEANEGFVEKTKSVFKSMIEAIKKFTKNLIETIKKKVSDTAFKVKLNKLRRQLDLNKDFKLKNDKKYIFKNVDEACKCISNICEDTNKIMKVLSSKTFKKREDFDEYAEKLLRALTKKYSDIFENWDNDVNVIALPDDVKIYISNQIAQACIKQNEIIFKKADDQLQHAIEIMQQKAMEEAQKKAQEMYDQMKEEQMTTTKITWYKKITNTMISGCNKVKTAIAKHPFVVVSAVAAALSGVGAGIIIGKNKKIKDLKNYSNELENDSDYFQSQSEYLTLKNKEKDAQIRNLEKRIRRAHENNEELNRYGAYSF